jgi:hypothetical protein
VSKLSPNFAIGRDGLILLADLVEALDHSLPSDADFAGKILLPPHPGPRAYGRVEVNLGYLDGKAYALFADPELT